MTCQPPLVLGNGGSEVPWPLCQISSLQLTPPLFGGGANRYIGLLGFAGNLLFCEGAMPGGGLVLLHG